MRCIIANTTINKLKHVIISIRWWIKNSIGYFFLDPHGKAYFRWRLQRGEKKRFIYDLNEDSIVFDVGGYKGDFSNVMLQKYNPNIYIFEPVKEFADAINVRFEKNVKIHVQNIGLSNASFENKIYLSEDGSSVYDNGSDNLKSESINMKDIVEFIDENKIKRIDLLKLNIEGGEYAVLDRLFESGYIDRIKYLQVQFHNISPTAHKKMEEQILKLEETHRLMWKCRPFIWESWELIS